VISSRKSVPPLRALEDSLAHALGAREAAALVAEQLRFDQTSRRPRRN
jgi:hypothetical protein